MTPTKPEQPGANHLSIEERLEQAVLELEPSLMCENSYAKPILRRYFGDLGGDYSCAVCGFGMKEPCEHWKKMLAASAGSQSPAVNSIHEIRPFELPSCHICGAQMTPKTYKCESCKATTGVEPTESPFAETDNALRDPLPSNPLCRIEGCGKPLRYHIDMGRHNSHSFDITRERRIGAKERREHKEALNPACNRFRMNGWTWWSDARVNIRTGPFDRRKAQPPNCPANSIPQYAQPGTVGASSSSGSTAGEANQSETNRLIHRAPDSNREVAGEPNLPRAESASVSYPPAQPGKKEAQVCNDCKGVYGTWFAPNEIWNAVVYDRVAGMLCPNCFMFRAGLYGLMVTWELRPADYRSPAACECESPMPSWNPDWRFCLKCGGRMASDSHAPRGNAAQPGKKEGESTDAPSTVLPLRNVQDHGESTARAAGTSVTSAAPPRCVTAEAVKAYRHRLMHRDNATKTAPLSSWSDAEVAAFASSLLAERDRTIAELRAKSEHYRVEAINQGCKREQAEQERDALKGSTWGAAYEVTQKAVATAERLRGLLRELDTLVGQVKKDCYGGSFVEWSQSWYGLRDALRQRIQKELEGRP